MRKSHLLPAALLLVLAGPAWADGADAPPGAVRQHLDADSDIEVVPAVSPGDQIGITCNALAQTDAQSDVRVVLTISAAPGETPPGYNSVLATDEEVGKGAVRVRIPAMPELSDRTVNVNVYVVGDKGAEKCPAGHLKIVRAKPEAPAG